MYHKIIVIIKINTTNNIKHIRAILKVYSYIHIKNIYYYAYINNKFTWTYDYYYIKKKLWKHNINNAYNIVDNYTTYNLLYVNYYFIYYHITL